MGFMNWLMEDVLDDALGFQDVPDPKMPGAQPAVATTTPATNTPNVTPVQESYNRAQSYLAAQSQLAFNRQLKELSGASVSAPPTFTQTAQGQKLIKFGIIGLLAWLFLFKGKL